MKTNKEIKIVEMKRALPLRTTEGKKIYAVEFEGAIFFEEGEESIINDMVEEAVRKLREKKITVQESTQKDCSEYHKSPAQACPCNCHRTDILTVGCNIK